MKKLTYGIVLLAAGLILSSSAFGQKKNAIKVNIFSPIFRTGSFFYERALNEATSAQLGFFYTGYKITDTKFSGYGITPEFRFYPSKNEDLKGFYLGPFLRYQSFSLTEDVTDSKGTFSAFGGGLLIGGQFLFGNVVTLDIFIGPAYYGGSTKVESGSEDAFDLGSFDGFGVRTGVTIGIAF